MALFPKRKLAKEILKERRAAELQERRMAGKTVNSRLSAWLNERNKRSNND